MMAVFFAFGENRVSHLTAMNAKEWAAFLFSAWTGIAIGHALYFKALDEAGVTIGTAIIQLQPLTVGIGSYLLFSESFTVGQIVSGAAAIAAAAAMVCVKMRLVGAGAGGTSRAAEAVRPDGGGDLNGVELQVT